ncbi:MAG: hypothetical protein LBV67_07125 [Streptococcaceae bacterium]|jgi:hypothetical protein|nr:hypothetical protein [Streptococcaceae bacterium]
MTQQAEQYFTKEQTSSLLTIKQFEEAMKEYSYVYSWGVVQCEHLALARDNISKRIIRNNPNYKADAKLYMELRDNALQRSEYLKFGLIIAQMEKARQVAYDNYGIIEQILRYENQESEYQARF